MAKKAAKVEKYVCTVCGRALNKKGSCCGKPMVKIA